jgi:hypothetical protein
MKMMKIKRITEESRNKGKSSIKDNKMLILENLTLDRQGNRKRKEDVAE